LPLQPPTQHESSAEVLWQRWQLAVLQLLLSLHPVLVQLGISAGNCCGPSVSTASAAGGFAPNVSTAVVETALDMNTEADAAAVTEEVLTVADAAAGDAASSSVAGSTGTRPGEAGDTHDGSSSSSSSSSTSPRWHYLLEQPRKSKRWAEAAAVFDSRWPDALGMMSAAAAAAAVKLLTDTGETSDSSNSSSNADGTSSAHHQQLGPDDITQLYADALQLCRALVAAAPLPLVCNNPSCDNLVGASETTVATKLCAGCRCRYCSAACQAADWRRHRRGCKAMAAAGLVAS
jgi:hypothetical protein